MVPKRRHRAQNNAPDNCLKNESLLPRHHKQNGDGSRHHVGTSRHVIIGPSTVKISLVIFSVLFLASALRRNLRRNISNHKLISSDDAALISTLITLGVMAVVVCSVGMMKCVRRGRNFGITAASIFRGEKHLIAMVLVLPTVAFIAFSSGNWRECGSSRILRDSSGEKGVRLCADGMSFGGHLPSRLFLWGSAIRFLGDTFLFRDEQTIPHLDWRTAVLDTAQCVDALKDVLEKKPIVTPRCNNAMAARIGPPPADDGKQSWPTEREGPAGRENTPLPPFRVSNELRRPYALQQAKMVAWQLDECRFDSPSRIVLEPLSPSSPSPPLEIVKSEYGNGVAIVLSASNFAEYITYHITQMDSGFHCLFLALQNAALMEQRISVILPCSWGSPIGVAVVRALAHVHGADVVIMDQNYTFIQRQSYRSLVHVHGPYFYGDVADVRRSGSLGLPWPLWDSFKFERHRLPSPFGVNYADAVRRGNQMQLKHQRNWPESREIISNSTEHVLVVQRRGNQHLVGPRKGDRRLVGSRTGSFVEIIDAMCNLGLPVRTIEFEALSAEEQIDAAASATVMVAAHGSALSHSSWMRPGGAVVEVLIRQGFDGTSDYHKADFANLARFFGVDYIYYDAIALGPKDEILAAQKRMENPTEQTPVDYIDTVVVDAEELARVVLCLYQKARDR